jgi:hypothetical protein
MPAPPGPPFDRKKERGGIAKQYVKKIVTGYDKTKKATECVFRGLVGVFYSIRKVKS